MYVPFEVVMIREWPKNRRKSPRDTSPLRLGRTEPSSRSPSPAALVSTPAGANAAVADAGVAIAAQPVRAAGHERVVRRTPPDGRPSRCCGRGQPRKRIEVAKDRSILDRLMDTGRSRRALGGASPDGARGHDPKGKDQDGRSHF